MEVKWTTAQLAAINTTDKTLLVSAAAGSGKTATLTQRIIQSLTDPEHPCDLDNLLVVTFTRASAEDLKRKIFEALSQAQAKDPSNRRLTAQMLKLSNARISTIDSFYLDVIRSHFSQLGISSSFRIADNAEMAVLKKKVMEDVIEQFYDEDKYFPLFVECFTGTRSTDQLSKILIQLAHRISSVPEGIDFFLRSAEQAKKDAEEDKDFFDTALGQVIRAQSINTVIHCHNAFCEACEYMGETPERVQALLPSFVHDRDFCASVLGTLQMQSGAYKQTKILLEYYSAVRRKTLKNEVLTEEGEQYLALRTSLNKLLKGMREKYFSKDPETIRQAMVDTARHTETLYRVLRRYEQMLSEEKQKRNTMEFQDIRRHTLNLLVHPDGTPTEVAKEYAEQFSHIYIDEYQDVDMVQDLIFRSISRPDNRFMVGDIKQSIYSFRGAEPQVFSGYRSAFPDLDTEHPSSDSFAKIFMSENFRCDKNVIQFTNLVCSRIFSVCTKSIGYKPEDDLVHAKQESTLEGYTSPKVQVSVLLAPKKDKNSPVGENEESPEKQQLEAEHVADIIAHLLQHETKADGKPFQPGDIAVLFRSNATGGYVADALHRRNIQSSQKDCKGYFESPDVLMVLCILNAVDNPHRDVFLAGALRSPIYGFSMEDLIHIRSAADPSYSLYDALLCYAEKGDDPLAERCRCFRDTLESLRQSAVSLPIDRFLRILFESDAFISSGLFHQRGRGGSGNLLSFYEYARGFESGSFKGLYNFIEFINSLMEDGKKMELPSQGSSPDRVRLLNIHQSKGLEFPACILCGIGSKFNKKDLNPSLLLDYPTGVAMKIADTTGFARINTPMREAVSSALDEKMTEEEMRVLYVALSRARERLFITATTTEEKEKLMEQARSVVDFNDRFSLLHCKSMLEWILLPFAKGDPDCAELSFHSVVQDEDSEADPVECVTEEKAVERNEELYCMLKEKFSYQYPYTHMKRIPAKLSVSRLSPNVLDSFDTSADLFPGEKSTKVPDFFITGTPSRASAAERGTATHLFLQFCDFRYAADHGIREEIARLVSKGFFPDHIASLIYVQELESFLQSDLFRIIRNAKSLIREQRFNLLLSPDAFTDDPSFRREIEGERLAVQGVIDLIVIDADDRLWLIDYKTDRLSSAELTDFSAASKRLTGLHGLQLSYYAHAAAQLFERPCDRLAIYSTHGARLIDVKPIPLRLSENVSHIL